MNPRIPHRQALSQVPASRILRSLDFGAMMAVAYPLSRDELQAVAAFIGTAGPAPGPQATAASDWLIPPGASWNGWSPTSTNARYQSANAAGLSVAEARRLKVKWAFGFAGDVTAFAQPSVVDGQVFVGSAGSVIHAMRAETGCLQWVFQANRPVRSAILAVPLGVEHALLFGDQTGWFYALAAETGKLLWKKKIEEHDAPRLTGAPVAHNGSVFLPVASWEETRALNPEYPCCTFRGSVVALRIRDGKQVWKSYTIANGAKETGKTRRGTPQLGPSGAGIWSAPTHDGRRWVGCGILTRPGSSIQSTA